MMRPLWSFLRLLSGRELERSGVFRGSITLLRLCEPSGILLLAHDTDFDGHIGVAVAAQLRALAEIYAFLLGLEPGLVQASGNGIDLDVEGRQDRKSTRLNSSHANISYAVFCL